MTRTYIEYCGTYVHHFADARRHPLNRCRAEWFDSHMAAAAALYSYDTLAAVYWRGTVWELDRWSATTTMHVRKWAHLLDAPVVPLYRVSRMGKRDAERHTACDWSDVIAAVVDTL